MINDISTLVMPLTVMAIVFINKGEKSETIFFSSCCVLVLFRVENYFNYNGKDGIIYFSIFISLLFLVLRFIRFTLLKKYDKKLF